MLQISKTIAPLFKRYPQDSAITSFQECSWRCFVMETPPGFPLFNSLVNVKPGSLEKLTSSWRIPSLLTMAGAEENTENP